MDATPSIERLSQQAVSAIRSGISVPTVAQAVEELVANAIDASAKTISIRLDIKKYWLSVDDDGSGIKDADLPLVGQRYHTSKCQQLEDLTSKVTSYGFRGEALSSLRDVASVTITTRTNDSNALTRSCKLDSKGARTGLAATHRVAAGTTVVVSDLFKAAPVRRRCITTGDMEEARRRVETIALAHPGVAFALYNSNTGQQLLKVARTDTACSTFEQIFGSEKSSHLIPVSAQTRSTNTGAGAGKGSHSTNTITVSGYVSVGSHHNRQLQFMYINGRHVYSTRFHKLINQLLPLTIDNPDAATSTAPRTGKRCAIFVLNVTCPPASYDICFEPQKTWIEFADWDAVLKCVRNALDTVLPPPATPRTTGADGGGGAAGAIAAASTSTTTPLASIFVRSGKGSGSSGSGRSHSVVTFSSPTPSSNRRISLTPLTSSSSSSSRSSRFALSDSNGGGGGRNYNCSGNEDADEENAGKPTRPVVPAASSPSLMAKASQQSSVLASPKMLALSRFSYEASQHGEVSATATRTPRPRLRTSRAVTPLAVAAIPSNTDATPSLQTRAYIPTSTLTESTPAASTQPPTPAAAAAAAAASPFEVLSLVDSMVSSFSTASAAGPAAVTAASSALSTPRPSQSGSGVGNTAASASGIAPSTTFTSSYAAKSANKRRRVASGKEPSSSRTNSSVGTPTRMCSAPTSSNSSSTFGSCGGSCACGSSTGLPFLSPNVRLTRPQNQSRRNSRNKRSRFQSSSSLDGAGAGAGAGAGGAEPPAPNISITDLEQEEINSILSTFAVQEDDADADAYDDDTFFADDGGAAIHGNDGSKGNAEVRQQNEDAFSMTSGTIVKATATAISSTNRPATPPPLTTTAPTKLTSPVPPSAADAVGLRRVKWRELPQLAGTNSGSNFNYNTLDDDEDANDDDDTPAPTTLSGPSTLDTWLAEGAHTITPYGPGITRPSSILPRQLTKDMLGRLQVINQVDCKFIVCKLGSAVADGLYIVDQHAAHERVRLEDLTIRLCTPAVGEVAGVAGIYGTRILKAAIRDPPLLLDLNASDIEVLIRFKRQMAQLGLEFRQYSSSSFAAGGRARPSIGAVHAYKVPAPMVRSTTITITNFVKVQLGVLHATGGATLAPGVIPTPILDVLNLRACHGAIKFGDPLSHDECARLIDQLSKCRIPFQCAHGRPTVIPLTSFGG